MGGMQTQVPPAPSTTHVATPTQPPHPALLLLARLLGQQVGEEINLAHRGLARTAGLFVLSLVAAAMALAMTLLRKGW